MPGELVDVMNLGREIRDERGGVLVWFAVMGTAIFFLVAFVIDIGNYFEHRRHLQLQADAAALAGGTAWAYPCDATTETNIENLARDYGGPHVGHTGSPYNAQIGNTATSNLHLLLNSTQYWNHGGTDHSDGGGPCATGFLDVRVTDSHVRSFFNIDLGFPLSAIIPSINAHARVEAQKVTALSGLLPLFVRDINPRSGAALFVTGSGSTASFAADPKYMQKSGSCASGLGCWSNASNRSSVTVGTATSLVVALSSLPQCPQSAGAPCFDIDRSHAAVSTPALMCSQSGVECYASDGTSQLDTGLVFIRGFDDTTSTTCCVTNGAGPYSPPVVREVELAGNPFNSATCADGYFVYLTSGSCTVAIRAKVDMTSAFASSQNAQVTAFSNPQSACGNNGTGLSFDSTTGYWVGNCTIDAASRAVTFSIEWRLKKTNVSGYGDCTQNFNGPCHDQVNGAQRVYGGLDVYSGPVRVARVWNADASPPPCTPALTTPFYGFPQSQCRGANAYPNGSVHSLYAEVQVAGAVATSTSDPPVQLRVVDKTAGNDDTNQSGVDCEQGVNYRNEITKGCVPLYTVTPESRLSAPDPCNPPYPNAQSVLTQATPPARDCAATANGASVGQFSDGIIGRVLKNGVAGTYNHEPCPAANGTAYVAGRNYWNPPASEQPNPGGIRFPNFHIGDPRVVLVFMVPFGAFRDSGKTVYPITNFGAFYITGWGGKGNNSNTDNNHNFNDDPCPGADSGVDKGWLSGHFISYVLPPGSGGIGGGGTCDPSVTTPCIVQLTK